MYQMKRCIYVLGFVVGMMCVQAGAIPTEDIKRDLTAAKQQAESLAAKANEEVIKEGTEKAQKAEQGNASCDQNPENSKNKKRYLTTEAYDYIYKNVLKANDDDEADEIIKPDTNYMQNRINVKKKFFAESHDSGLTERGEMVNNITSKVGINMSQEGLKTEEVRRVMDERKEYASQVAAKNLKISLELREKIIKDIASTQSTETGGCNQIQGLVMENSNLGALVKETVTDIVVQILTLESLGAKMLLKEDAGLIRVPQKPEDEKKKKK